MITVREKKSVPMSSKNSHSHEYWGFFVRNLSKKTREPHGETTDEAMGSAGGIAFFHAPAVYSEGRHFRAEYS